MFLVHANAPAHAPGAGSRYPEIPVFNHDKLNAEDFVYGGPENPI